MATDNYGKITDRLIEALENGDVPWRKPWKTARGGSGLQNAVSGRNYSGINPILLNLTMHSEGFTDPRFLTYKHAVKLGGHISRGSKGTRVAFWIIKKIVTEDDDGEQVARKRFSLGTHTVFNVEQAESLTLEPLGDVSNLTTHEPVAAAEKILGLYPDKPSVELVGSQASYSKVADRIKIPQPELFKSPSEFYSTLFHEMVHSTGHKSRLGRKTLTDFHRFGDPEYSKEELVAEFGAAFLCGDSGILPTTLENSAAYIRGWLDVLTVEDKEGKRINNKLAVHAASQATKAANFIQGKGV